MLFVKIKQFTALKDCVDDQIDEIATIAARRSLDGDQHHQQVTSPLLLSYSADLQLNRRLNPPQVEIVKMF